MVISRARDVKVSDMKLAIVGMFLILGAAVLSCGGSDDPPTPTARNMPQPTATGVSTAVPESTNEVRSTRASGQTSPPSTAKLPPGVPELYRAIWAGTIDEVRALVADGKAVNASNEDGDPLLYTAIWRAEPEKVQILVEAGADVNAKDSDGDPLLHTAVWRKRTEALKILIAAGADVNARDSRGDPLLYTAVWREIPESARILIDAGADVNAKDSGRRSVAVQRSLAGSNCVGAAPDRRRSGCEL